MRLGDPFLILEKCSFYFALSSVLKREGKESITWISLLLPFSRLFWRVSLSFFNYFSKFHIMTADVGLVSSGPAWFLGLINSLKPLSFTFLLPQITRPNLLWALKAKFGVFWARPSVVKKMGLYTCSICKLDNT